MTWALANVEERAAKSPATFQIPGRRIRESLSVDNVAKLVFVDEHGEHGERMWVTITGRTDVTVAGRRSVGYIGTLNNHPVTFQGELRYGQRISFSPEHVADWDVGP